MKKFLTILLTLAAVVCLFAAPACAASSGTCGNNLTWTLDSEGTLTISGSGGMYDYSVSWFFSPPSSSYYYYYSNTPWYSSRSSIQTVVIGDSVTSIDDYAFSDCSSLTSVTIGDSVTSIGDSAFWSCGSLTSVYYTGDVAGWCGIEFGSTGANPLSYAKKLYINNTLVTDLVIPEGVTEIKPYAFYGCDSLTSVTIGDSVTSISDSAFSGCSSLIKVTIGNSVTSIGDYAFSDCSSLTSVTIGDSMTSIGRYAFRDCDSLTSVTIPDSVASIGNYAFYGCDSLTSVTIGDSVTSIGRYAFYNCSSLTSVYYTGDVAGWCGISFEDPDANPLYNAEKLYINNTLVTDLVIPDSVTSIGNYAFSGCYSLTSVTIPDSVASIGNYAFSCCSSLTSVTIGDSVTSIGSDAFYSCSSLTSVYYTGDVAGWCGISFEDSAANPLSYAKKLYINNTLVTDLVIPKEVDTIKMYTFCNAACLKSVELPLSLVVVGKNAFYGCSGITKVSYPGTAEQWAEILFAAGNEAITQYAPEHAHDWEDVAVITAPTCHTGGSKTCKCTVCGTTETMDVPATGEHTWDEGEVTKVPNRYETGTRFHTCTAPGCAATWEEVLPKELPGDLNGDGKITTKDAILLLRAIAGTAELY